jgi:hypothetical protein
MSKRLLLLSGLAVQCASAAPEYKQVAQIPMRGYPHDQRGARTSALDPLRAPEQRAFIGYCGVQLIY